jgi:hypothetical protein
MMITKPIGIRNIYIVLMVLLMFAITVAPVMAYNLTAFSVVSNTGEAAGTFGTGTITVAPPKGTDVTNMIAFFTVSNGATVTVNSAEQESGYTENDFTSPLTYVVTTSGGPTETWVVTVTPVSTGSSYAADFLTYSIPNQYIAAQIRPMGVIADGDIIVTMPYGTDATNLTATYTTSTSTQSVKVGSTVQTSGVTKNDFSSYYGLDYVITSEAGSTKTWNVLVNVRNSPETNITAFSVPGQISSTINNVSHTVAVTVPYGTDRNMAASFTLSDGASANISAVPQYSGVTTNNFASPVTYEILAADLETSQDWVVTVSYAKNTAAEITAFTIPANTSQTINSAAGTVTIAVPHGTDVSHTQAHFTLSYGAGANVSGVSQTSGVTYNNFGSPVTYVVTAEDGLHTKTWLVTVNTGLNTAAEFSSYTLPGQVEGSTVITSGTGSIQITMPTGSSLNPLVATFVLTPSATAKVGTTAQVSGTTPNNFNSPVEYVVTAPDLTTTKTWRVTVVTAPSTNAEILTYSLPGQYGSARIRSGDSTVNVTMPLSGTDTTSLGSIAASFALSTGAAATNVSGVTQITGLSLNDFRNPVTYKVTAADAITNKTWTINAVKVGFTSFSLPSQSGTTVFNNTARTVNLSVPYGTSLTSVAATFTTIAGSSTVKIGSTAQTSGVTTNNYNSPVTYLVTGQDGDEVPWTVNVRTLPNTATVFTIFGLPGQIGSSVIDNSATVGTINVTVAYVRNKELVATYALSDGASAKVGSAVQQSGVTANNFTNPVTYLITAQDGSTTKNWNINLTVLQNSAANITAFSLPTVTGAGTARINYTAGTVNISVPIGTTVSALVPTFTPSDYATAKVGSTVQTSGSTTNDFTSPVTYTVTSQDGLTTKDWVVNVNIGLVTDNIGVYKDGYWYLDYNGDGLYTTADKSYGFGIGLSGTSVLGDWNGDGHKKIGVYKNGYWYLDYNGDGLYTTADKSYAFGVGSGGTPVVGNWNGGAQDEIGVYSNGYWYLDYNGDGLYTTADKSYAFGVGSGGTPVVGKWNGGAQDEIGVYSNGYWYLDYNGDGLYTTADKSYGFGIGSGGTSVLGDWNGDGQDKIGVYNNGYWYLDYNGDGLYTAEDKSYGFGIGLSGTSAVGAW